MLDKQREYLESIRAGRGEITAARDIGATAAEMARYTATDAEFAAAVEEALAERFERVANKVWEKAQAGDSKELELVLATQGGREWLRPDREMVLKMAQPDELTPAQIEDMHQRLLKRAAIDVEEVADDGGSE